MLTGDNLKICDFLQGLSLPLWALLLAEKRPRTVHEVDGTQGGRVVDGTCFNGLETSRCMKWEEHGMKTGGFCCEEDTSFLGSSCCGRLQDSDIHRHGSDRG